MGLYLQISIALLSIALAIVCIIIYVITSNIKKCVIYVCICVVGIMQIHILENNYNHISSKIPEEITVKALITSNVSEKEYKYTYTVTVSEINGKKLEKGIQLIANIKKNKVKKVIPKFGDVVEITGIYEEPNTARNYKGFDYKQYLKSKNIYGTVDCEKYEIIETNKISIVSNIVNYVQNNIKENMFNILDEEQGALCVGILIGDREKISDITEDNFKKSNLTHMLAVSGSHITYIIVALTTILSKTNRKLSLIITIFFLIFFTVLTGFTVSVLRASIMGILTLLASILHRKSDTINNLGISSIIILIYNPYLLVDAGFLLSYAGTIGILSFSKKIEDGINKIIIQKLKTFSQNIKENSTVKKVDGTNNENTAKEKNNNRMLIEVNEVIDDSTVIGAEANRKTGTTEFIEVLEKVVSYIICSFSVTLSANIVIIPVMAYMFSTISFTFWVSNILAGPVMEIVTIFGFIVYFISIIFPILAQFLGIALNLLLTVLLKIAEISSKIPGASIYIKTPNIYMCVIYYLLIYILFNAKTIKQFIRKKAIFRLCIIKAKKQRKKILVVTIIFTILLNSIIYVTDKNIKIYFVDVGQGDCTLIQTPEKKNILVDGGGSEFGSFDVGESTLLPYLLDRGITKIDYMMISHFDSDHIGGLFYIMENLRVDNIIISKQGENSENFKKFIKLMQSNNRGGKNKTNIILVKKGDNIKIDNSSYFEILFPEEELINDNILNNNSIVAKFVSNNFKMLFTGDIEEIAENRLCELYKSTNKLQADIIKVAHHGSKTSSTFNFLELVKPKIALIGVGANNNFGHPNEEVLERIENLGTHIYRTDQMGEISIVIGNKGNIKIDSLIEKEKNV